MEIIYRLSGRKLKVGFVQFDIFFLGPQKYTITNVTVHCKVFYHTKF
jgi:hypothetical protein